MMPTQWPWFLLQHIHRHPLAFGSAAEFGPISRVVNFIKGWHLLFTILVFDKHVSFPMAWSTRRIPSLRHFSNHSACLFTEKWLLTNGQQAKADGSSAKSSAAPLSSTPNHDSGSSSGSVAPPCSHHHMAAMCLLCIH